MTAPSPPPDRLGPLRVGTFRALWLASLASNLGALIQNVGAAWLMTSLSDSADMVALVQASATLPIMALALLSGAIADGFDRRRVMLAAQFFMLVVSAALTIFAWLGLLTPWTLLAFTFLVGIGVALNNPAWQATVGDVVSREELPAAVLLNSVGFNVTRSVGPAIGGAIVAAAGAAAAFAVNALSYLGLITVLWRWRPRTAQTTLPREALGSAITAGVRYVAMSPHLTRVLLRGFLFGGSAIAVLALLPLVARDRIGGDAFVYGVLLGAFGIGAVGGAALSPRIRERLSNEALVRASFVAFALASALVAVSRSVWLAAPGLLVAGGAWVMALALFNTTVQLSTPRWVVGRALSLYQMAIFGGMAVGAWLWGSLADRSSLPAALLAAATALLFGAAIGLRLPLPSRAELNLDPLNRWREPEVALDIRPRSGPVAIFVEYEIEEASAGEFLDLMAQRRRIRRRDGAQQWTLLRDLENPRLWVERFVLPTWVDYVRFHARTTQADAPIGDRIRALHAGDGLPRVRRMLIRSPVRRRTEAAARPPVDLT